MNALLPFLPEDVARMLGNIIPDEFDQKALQLIKHPRYQAVDDALMAYYRQYKVEMIEIFEDNYSRQLLPGWVNYDGLKIEKLELMINTLFTQILDKDLLLGGSGDIITVNFNWELALAVYSDNLDPSSSRFVDGILNLGIHMDVSFLELGG